MNKIDIMQNLNSNAIDCGFDGLSIDILNNTYCLDTRDSDGMLSSMFSISVFGKGYADYVIAFSKNPSAVDLLNLKKFIDENLKYMRDCFDCIFEI